MLNTQLTDIFLGRRWLSRVQASLSARQGNRLALRVQAETLVIVSLLSIFIKVSFAFLQLSTIYWVSVNETILIYNASFTMSKRTAYVQHKLFPYASFSYVKIVKIKPFFNNPFFASLIYYCYLHGAAQGEVYVFADVPMCLFSMAWPLASLRLTRGHTQPFSVYLFLRVRTQKPAKMANK